MKILCDNSIEDLFINNIIDCLRYTTQSINGISDMTKVTQVLIQLSPNLIIFKQENITPEVKAYCDKNKVKIISMGENNDKYGDIFVSYDTDLTYNGLRHIQKINLPNLLIRNSKPKNYLKYKMSLISSNETNEFFMKFLDKNYKIRIYGNKSIKSPKYLGRIDVLQRGSILASSDINIDINSYTYIDSILLNKYPIIYTDKELPDTMIGFSDMLGLINAIEYVEHNTNDIKNRISVMQEQLFSKNNITVAYDILDTLGFKSESNTLKSLKESLI